MTRPRRSAALPCRGGARRPAEPRTAGGDGTPPLPYGEPRAAVERRPYRRLGGTPRPTVRAEPPQIRHVGRKIRAHGDGECAQDDEKRKRTG